MLFARNRRLSIVNLVILLTMLGGLLMGACGQSDIDINIGPGDNADGFGNMSQTSLFALMVVLFLAMVALVLVAGRSRS